VVVAKPRDWIAEAVLLADGRNVLNEEIDFEPGQVYDNVRVVLSNKAATITGTIQIDWRIVPPGGVVVTVFPEDPALWRVESGWVHRTDPDDSGYTVRGIRPGRAYLVAPHPWHVSGYASPKDFYQTLAKTAKRVFVAKPGNYRVDLTIR